MALISQLICIVLFQLGFLGIIGFCEFLYQKKNVDPEITRKLAHVLATLSSLGFAVIFDSHWYVFILGLFSFLLLFIGKKKGAFQSIERIRRKSEGSYLLPVSIYLSFMVADFADKSIYFVLPLLVLGICDPLAGLAGMSLNPASRPVIILGYRFQKTLTGSFVFLVSALSLTILTLAFYGTALGSLFPRAFVIASVVTLAELLSSGGLDNLTIPATTAVMLALTSG